MASASRSRDSASWSAWASAASRSAASWRAASAVGLAKILGGFLTLGLGNGVAGDCLLAVGCLDLLELSFLHEVVLAGHGAGDFLRLADDVVQQSFTGLFGFVIAHGGPVPIRDQITHGRGVMCTAGLPRPGSVRRR
jgi:hypothetical protein